MVDWEFGDVKRVPAKNIFLSSNFLAFNSLERRNVRLSTVSRPANGVDLELLEVREVGAFVVESAVVSVSHAFHLVGSWKMFFSQFHYI